MLTTNFNAPPKKIALPQLGGISYVLVDEIVSLEADGNYTVIHKSDKHKLVISKSLKEFDDLLDQNMFIRIHKSYIINLTYVKEYSTVEGATVKMTDGNEWSISRRQLDMFMNKMSYHSLTFKSIKGIFKTTYASLLEFCLAFIYISKRFRWLSQWQNPKASL